MPPDPLSTQDSVAQDQHDRAQAFALAAKLAAPAKIILADFKILPGEYKAQLHPKISKWENMSGVDYFVSCQA